MDVKNDTPVRTSKEIKKALLRKAWDGNSQRTGAEMIALIQERVRRSQDLPIEHSMELAQVDDAEPRAIRALNLVEKENGSTQRFTDATRKSFTPTMH